MFLTQSLNLLIQHFANLFYLWLIEEGVTVHDDLPELGFFDLEI